MLDKKLKRQRRAAKGRAKIRELRVTRLCVGRSAKHLYTQLITPGEKGDRVLASVSTLEKEVRARITTLAKDGETSSSRATFNNIKSAAIVGSMIAERALAAGISRVALDRSGFKYHGRIKALAEAAREAGLLF
jgi:large subunit ribosomal protein L18